MLLIFSFIQVIPLNKSQKHRLLTLNTLISYVQIIAFSIQEDKICPFPYL